MQIVAVVFGNFDYQTNEITYGEKPYFYLDLIGLAVNDHGLVHSDKWGIVQVKRVLLPEEGNALGYVTKPIMAKVTLNHEMIKNASTRIKEFANRTVDQRIQQAIDEKLYPPNTRVVAAQQRLEAKKPVMPPSFVSKDIDDEIPF